jgi:hypothetical protein
MDLFQPLPYTALIHLSNTQSIILYIETLAPPSTGHVNKTTCQQEVELLAFSGDLMWHQEPKPEEFTTIYAFAS